MKFVEVRYETVGRISGLFINKVCEEVGVQISHTKLYTFERTGEFGTLSELVELEE